MLSKLISDFYGLSQKSQETGDVFADDLWVLARKNIAQKSSFSLEANHQLKAQYVHKLQDPYYAAKAYSMLQSSPEEETFTWFRGCLVTMFGRCTTQGKSSVASTGINAEISQVGSKLWKNSRQWQNKINKQKAQINSLQNENKQLGGLLDHKLLVSAISQAVTTSLKVNSQPVNEGGSGNNGTGYISKPYLGKPWPSQLAPGADRSLNPDLEYQYCKDTGHLKENCIIVNCQLAQE